MDNVRSWSWVPAGATFAVLPLYVTALGDGAELRVHVTSAVVAIVLVMGAWWLWQREQRRRSSPRSEYLVVAYVGTYYATAILTLGPGDRLLDWAGFLPPVSVLPLLSRVLLGDGGSNSSAGRRTARLLHRVFGVGFAMFAVYLGVTIWLLAAVPLAVIAAGLHLLAAKFYRQSSEPVPPAGP